MGIDVFISYSHQDSRLAERLRDHLSPLVQRGCIREWHDRRIEPGEDWANAIDNKIDSCDLVLFLVSPSFYASGYCVGVEVERALARQRDGTRVVPVMLKDVDWEGTPLSKLQALPRDGRPVVRWRDRDQALRDVARGVRRIAENVGPQRAAAADERAPASDSDVFFLNHTSFLRADRQPEFRARTGIPVDHYDIRVIVDAYDEASLDKIERVEYELDPSYPEPIRVRTAHDRPSRFLLKELANGEYLLRATLSLGASGESIELCRYITLWESGPEL